MDPNETLNQLRGTIAKFFNTTEDDPERAFLGEEMADLFIGLDDWISRGGFYPTAWQAKRIGEPDKPL